MDKIHDIHERVERIEEKLEKIINLLEHNQKSADKMSDHIDFIDGVYNKVKSPLIQFLIQYHVFLFNKIHKHKCLNYQIKKKINI